MKIDKLSPLIKEYYHRKMLMPASQETLGIDKELAILSRMRGAKSVDAQILVVDRKINKLFSNI